MKKKGFSLIELIISIALIAVVSSFAIAFFVLRNKDYDESFSTVERTILDAAQLLVSIEYDLEGSKYQEQLNLGAQGLQISLEKLLKEGIIDENAINTLYNELLKSDSSLTKEEVLKYYILVLNGSFDQGYKDDPCNGMLTYYLSWQKDFVKNDKSLYLCGNLPNTIKTTVNVEIKEKMVMIVKV